VVGAKRHSTKIKGLCLLSQPRCAMPNIVHISDNEARLRGAFWYVLNMQHQPISAIQYAATQPVRLALSTSILPLPPLLKTGRCEQPIPDIRCDPDVFAAFQHLTTLTFRPILKSSRQIFWPACLIACSLRWNDHHPWWTPSASSAWVRRVCSLSTLAPEPCSTLYG